MNCVQCIMSGISDLDCSSKIWFTEEKKHTKSHCLNTWNAPVPWLTDAHSAKVIKSLCANFSHFFLSIDKISKKVYVVSLQLRRPV